MTRQSGRTKGKASAAVAASKQAPAASKKGPTTSKASSDKAHEGSVAGENDVPPPKTAKRTRPYATTVEDVEDEEDRPPIKRKEKPIEISDEDNNGKDASGDDEDEHAELGESL